MFKRITTSLSRPSQTVFFMKDSWKRVVLYILLLPIFLIIPLVITKLTDPSMNLSRYESMTKIIAQDLRVDGAEINNGILTYNETVSASFDYFTIYVGSQVLDNRTLSIVFETNDIVFYMSNVEFDRMSYTDLNLVNHDFSSSDTENLRQINIALKVFFEQQSSIAVMDVIIEYLFNFIDYLFVVLMMSFLMLIFISRIQFSFKPRFKLSVYLSTIWVFSEFVLILFNLQELEFISLLLVYIYHINVYRSMKVIKRGVVQ
ncbi:MAG: DUF1189 family protein [Acholeplasmataceae bacterium]|nr:DUF1189 family protein [Acholeplasmataceae bacterium]